MAWQETEEKCVAYLKRIVGNDIDIEIIKNGGSDSTAPDIVLKKGGINLFNIEVKEPVSQAGQFVISEDENGEFSFSQRNKCNRGVCQPIIDYINSNKITFKNIDTSGISVDCDKDLMYERVKEFYLNEKESKYFITKSGLNFIIFPTIELEKYFDISCIARKKKSGSKNVSTYVEDCVEEKVTSYLISIGISKDKFIFRRDDKYLKLVFIVDEEHNLGGKKFETECFNLNFSKQKTNEPKNEYIITILSHTNNPNIIFTLTLKPTTPGTKEALFLSELH